MEIRESRAAFRALSSLPVADIDFFDGPTLGRVLRSPRPSLAQRLRARGALADAAYRQLLELWELMGRVQPTATANALSFDNLYDVLLWIYREIPNYELAPDAERTKVVFRGQRNAEWLLITTAQRRLLNDGDIAANSASIGRFVDSIRGEFPKKLLSTELEQQAVAQHYGFATSLLDFTTDPDVAAYFAIDDAIPGTDGTIFLGDTTRLLRDGRVRFIKSPEYFPRPNRQSGLFIELAPDHDPSRLFTRLTFPHGPGLPHYAEFRKTVGDIVPDDEIAELATNVHSGAAGASQSVAMPSRFGPALTVVEDPAHPEVLNYGTRLMAYAGIITDTPALELRTDILQEILRSSPTGATDFIATVAMLGSQLLLLPPTDAEAVRPLVELAIASARLYAEVFDDASHLQRLRQAFFPRSVLLLGPDRGATSEMATRIAGRLRTWNRAAGEEPEPASDVAVVKMDFRGMPPGPESSALEAVARIKAMDSTLILLNLDEHVHSVGEAHAREFLDRVQRLQRGVVATSSPVPFGLLLGSYFELTVAPPGAEAVGTEPWTSRRWRDALERVEEAARTEPDVLKTLGSVPISAGRTVTLAWISDRRLGGSVQCCLRVACDSYTDRRTDGGRIAIEPGAVNFVLGGPLSAEDYQLVAAKLLDPRIVGEDFGSAAHAYVGSLEANSGRRQVTLSALYRMLEFHPMAEMAILALQNAAGLPLRQPFETL